eukprot:897777-Rhodomonas_salina.2
MVGKRNKYLRSQVSGSGPFGCQIGVVNFILGGRSGYAGGNIIFALKIPPSLQTHKYQQATNFPGSCGP